MDAPHASCRLCEIGDAACVEFVESVIIDEAAVRQMDAIARQAIVASPTRRLVIDFANVAYASSAVFGILIAIHRILGAKGRRLSICGMSPPMRQMFAVTRLDDLFEISENRAAALAAG